MAFAPPATATVYRVLASSVAEGSRIHWLVVPFRVTVAVRFWPAGFRSRNVADVVDPVGTTPCTASLNVTVTLAVRLIPVAFTAGARAVRVGAVVSAPAVVKFQLVVASGLFAVSRIWVAPPVSVTVYCVLLARLLVGFRTHWLVVPAVTVPAIGVEPGVAVGRMTNVAVVTFWTASLKVAVMSFAAATPVAFTAGTLAVTVGAVVSVAGG